MPDTCSQDLPLCRPSAPYAADGNQLEAATNTFIDDRTEPGRAEASLSLCHPSCYSAKNWDFADDADGLTHWRSLRTAMAGF